MIPRISCLIPIYNGGQYLAPALESVLAQTVADFEIIAVNDGSTDDSLATLERYRAADGRVRIFSQANGGIVSALNHGLQHCQGEFVARMDCDDIATPERFAIQITEFEAHPEAVGVGGLHDGIDENGRTIYAPVSPVSASKTRLDRFPPQVACLQHSAATFRRSAMVEAGGYRRAFPHAEDWDLYLRLSAFGELRNPQKLVLHYRQLSSSLSMRNLVVQETSAVLAELSAIARSRGLADPAADGNPRSLADYHAVLGDDLCPLPIVQRYIDFRLWRRTYGANLPDEKLYRRRIFKTLVNPSTYASRLGRDLNKRMSLSVANKLINENLLSRMISR